MSAYLVFSAAVTTASADNAAAGAQVELATLLATASSIDRVDARPDGVVFALDRGCESYRVTATTRGGEVVAVAITDVGLAHAHAAGRFTWLAHEVAIGASITRLAVDAKGTVIASIGTGARYELIAGTDGNAPVAARWAAAWDAPSND